MKIKFLKKTKKIYCLISAICIFGIGYSSRNISTSKEINADINFTDGNLEKFDYLGSAYYIKNSEYFFDYYIDNGTYNFTSSSIGLLFEIKPNLVANYFLNDEVYISFGIQYKVLSSIKFDIFAPENNYVKPPNCFRCYLDNYNNYYVDSSNLTYSSKTIDGYTTYSLNGYLPLYLNFSSSLYSLCQDFGKTLDTYKFKISFDFTIIDSIGLSNYLQNIDFTISTSLEASV